MCEPSVASVASVMTDGSVGDDAPSVRRPSDRGVWGEILTTHDAEKGAAGPARTSARKPLFMASLLLPDLPEVSSVALVASVRQTKQTRRTPIGDSRPGLYNGCLTRHQMRRSGFFSAFSAIQSCAEQSFTGSERRCCALSPRTLVGGEMAEIAEGGENPDGAWSGFSAETTAAPASRVIAAPDLPFNRREFGDARASRMGTQPLSHRGELAVIAPFPERFRISRHGGGKLQTSRPSRSEPVSRRGELAAIVQVPQRFRVSHHRGEKRP